MSSYVVQEEETFPSFDNIVLLRDTWSVIHRQVNTLGMETFQKLFEINSEVSHYVSPSCPDLDPHCIDSTTQVIGSINIIATIHLSLGH